MVHRKSEYATSCIMWLSMSIVHSYESLTGETRLCNHCCNGLHDMMWPVICFENRSPVGNLFTGSRVFCLTTLLTTIKLDCMPCMVTEAHLCEKLAKCHYVTVLLLLQAVFTVIKKIKNVIYTVSAAGILNICLSVAAVCNCKPKLKATSNLYLKPDPNSHA